MRVMVSWQLPVFNVGPSPVVRFADIVFLLGVREGASTLLLLLLQVRACC